MNTSITPKSASRRTSLFAFVLLATTFFFSFQVGAATITSVKNGNWSDGSTWNTGTVPTSGDAVIINTNITSFPGQTFNKSLTITSNGSLTGSGDVTMNSNLYNHGLLEVNDLVVNNGNSIHNNGEFNLTGGLTLNKNTSYTDSGIVSMSGSFVSNTSKSTLIYSSSFLVSQGNITLNDGGDFKIYSTTVVVNGNYTANKDAATIITGNPSGLTVGGNMTLNTADFTNQLGGVVTVDRDFTMNNGTFTNNGGVFFNGDFTNNGTYTGTGSGSQRGTTIIKGYSTSWGTINGSQDFCDNTASSMSKFVDLGNQPTSSSVLTHCKIAPLPVTLVSFTATQTSTGVSLKWATASELNNSHFEVLRSTNGTDYNVIGIVEGNGTSNVLIRYNYTDRTPVSGIVYYKLRQVDFNGESENSPVVSVKSDGNVIAATINLYPNPVGNASLNVAFNQNTHGMAQVQIVNAAGTQVYTSTTEFHPGLNTIQVNTQNLKSGIYILIFNDGVSQTSSRFSK